ncbi:MAG: hypothetical protein K0S20_47 [Patescibacteria group bacterium]|jgi:ABC-type lipoprotein release transport system permease subunit|nr:hypothetical protein [Patescibacteria group bacterium]
MGAIAFSISVITYLVSFGMGLERLTLGAVSKSASLLSITVTSGSEELQPLNAAAVTKIDSAPKTEQVLPKLALKGEIILENQKAPATVIGVDPAYLQISEDSQLVAGSYYQKEDSQVMVVSSGFLKLFGLTASKAPLVVFSMTLDPEKHPDAEPAQNISVSGVVDSGAVVAYLPLSYVENLAGKNLPSYENAKVTVSSLDDVQSVSDSLIANGYKVSKVVDTIDEIKRVFLWIQMIMGGLGIIAIFVASIGMFNTLTVSLLERTREIGIMKALGVKKSDISRLFLTEALLMGLIGGLAGIGLAFLMQQITIFLLVLLATLAGGSVPQLFLNQWEMIGSFILLALAIAAITGIYPARRAAKINPIEAIRYE